MTVRPLALVLMLAAAGCTSVAPAPAPDEAWGSSTREPRQGGADASSTNAAPAPTPPPSEVDQQRDPRGLQGSPWPDRAHGQGPGARPAAGPVRFEAPERRDARPASTPLQDRPRLGLVVVRDGHLVHAPAVLLDLEARLDGAVAAVVAVRPGARASIGLDDLAALAREGGLDLVLVDVRLGGDAREAWLVATATRDLVGTFVVAGAGETTRAAPPEVELLARIERAWQALP